MRSLILAAILAALVPAHAETREPVTVDIVSAWGGLGNAPTFQLHAVKDGTAFRSDTGIVPREKIDALVAVLEAPPLPHIDQANFGIDAAWRETNADSALKEIDHWSRDFSEEQKALYLASFKDPQVMEQGLRESAMSFHTDDFPLVEAKVTFADGTSLTARGMSQSTFLVPYDMLPGKDRFNYNADISRAVAALMPDGATNRERLLGRDLFRSASRGVWLAIRGKLDMMKAQAQAPNVLALLGSRFRILDTHVDPYVDPLVTKDVSTDNLYVSLADPKLPPNVSHKVMLPLRGEEARDASAFLNSVDSARALFESIGWLQAYLRAHPKEKMWLTFAGNMPLGDWAFTLFTADMHALGKDKLADLVAAERPRVALLQTGIPGRETYWILLPDGRAILWRSGRDEGLLNWQKTYPKSGPCTEPTPMMGACVGAMISRDGRMEP